ncbi:MAG: 16S rRNA (cytosine(1402)-N(4))-methyltransferase RsmH [Aquificae bacterium]|nr:16S rRNA (cytosine(1402)-N(4))-methyltransferase RsmH [Aquificota bacterium]
MGEVHTPVLLNEVAELLSREGRRVYLDCTLGAGGHAKELLRRNEEAFLIGIDKDEEILEIAKENLKEFEGRFSLYKADYRDLDLVLEQEGIDKVDAVLFDLGVSMFQLRSDRGFSFQRDDPLDMRMDKDQTLTAYKVVNTYPERELARIIRQYGEERYASRIARAIVRRREKKPIETTGELVEVILSAVPPPYRHGRIHPATRTFQALRIEVNKELESLEEALRKVPNLLRRGGRLGVISFHSLEDRIVKHFMREKEKEGVFKVITKKPVLPSEEEVKRNPASRSAKLRVAERL